MSSQSQSLKTNFKPLWVLILSVILILLLGYYYNDPFIIWGSFHSARVVLYIAVPLIVNALFLQIPWAEIGWAKPKAQPKIFRWTIAAVILAPLLISLIHLSPDYLKSYTYYRNAEIPSITRFNYFLIFTLSTLLGWEILLRGFLLFGLRFLLAEKYRVEKNLAATLAILWVCCFEVLYHFVKPDLEALGMILASPILSWIAIKTRSFVIPLLLHLYIELAFISILIWT